MQCKHRTQEEWMGIIQTCRNSGLTDRAWCIQEGISPNTFYSAIKSLRKKSCDIPAPTSTRMPETHEIVPVSMVQDSLIADTSNRKSDIPVKANEYPAITLTVNGCVLEIQNTAGRDLIFHTISALRQL
jgi:hypothetical protein